MTQTEEEIRGEAAGHEGRFCLCESYARVTERAALAGARWLGRADQQAAEDDAATAMRLALEQLPIDGRIVIGAGGESAQLGPGETIGAGGIEADLALDPLEGRGVVARGGDGAMAVVAVGGPRPVQNPPHKYKPKNAGGPEARRESNPRQPGGDKNYPIAEAVW